MNLCNTLITCIALVSLSSCCQKKYFGSSSFVCVCNAKYCDLPGNHEIPDGEARIYTNTKEGKRFEYTTVKLRAKPSIKKAVSIININSKMEYQSVIGFGGAFTDSSGLNIQKLSRPLQDMLLRAYFTEEGADYNIGRIPIAGCDFSPRPYSYNDVPGDKDLKHFSLTEEDYSYKIPYIKRAIELSKQNIYLFGSPWSPPSWMKTNGKFNGTGELLKDMWQPWANYIIKFVEAYENEVGIKLWGITTQNDPLRGLEQSNWNSCGWETNDMRDWISQNLGPSLEYAGMGRLKIMVYDSHIVGITDYIIPHLVDETCNKFVDGIAVHWYLDHIQNSSALNRIHEQFPDKFMLYTESCEGWQDNEADVILGSWERGENYINNIIKVMNHWQTGWVDWNIALDMEGGPNWAGNFVDSPIIINYEKDEFYLQPMYAAMTHFSKFVSRDAKRIHFTISVTVDGNIRVAAFKNPDNTIVVIMVNLSNDEVLLELRDEEGFLFYQSLQAKSWHTVSYSGNVQEKRDYKEL